MFNVRCYKYFAPSGYKNRYFIFLLACKTEHWNTAYWIKILKNRDTRVPLRIEARRGTSILKIGIVPPNRDVSHGYSIHDNIIYNLDVVIQF